MSDEAETHLLKWFESSDHSKSGRIGRRQLDDLVAKYLGEDAAELREYLNEITDEGSQTSDYRAFVAFLFDKPAPKPASEAMTASDETKIAPSFAGTVKQPSETDATNNSRGGEKGKGKGKGGKGKGKAAGGGHAPPKAVAKAKVVRTLTPERLKKKTKEGEPLGMEQLVQKTADRRTQFDAGALEIEGIDISAIDPNAKQETYKCPRCEKDIRVSERVSHTNSHSAEILPWLFLGGARNGDNGRELTVRTGITHILNVAHEVNQDHEARDEWQAYNKQQGVPHDYKKFSWYDMPDQDIIKEMSGPLEFIREAHQADASHRVLVHCVQGISRSTSVVLLYLMLEESKTLRQAYDHVKQLRPLIEPRIEFLEQLAAFECKHFGLEQSTLDPKAVYAGKIILNVD